MNQEQVKSLIRSFISTFGGFIAGWFASKGWFTVDQTLAVLNSPVFIGIVTSGGAVVWGWINHTPTNTIAAANALTQVQGVIMAPTVEGKAIADSIPERSVAVAGTQDAKNVAAP